MGRDDRMSKREFIRYVAKKNNVTAKSLTKVFDMIADGIYDVVVEQDKSVTFVNVGRFYLHEHKGHQIQFSEDADDCKDSLVLKFSAAHSLNKKINDRKLDDKK